ncbi:MAG: DUF72 domain-containing protein [Actinomycetota bacterium]|nr:DUF72 domain-containing protein [Actinomycetota bacterium]
MVNNLTHIGTSGWSYDHWIGKFYPEEVKKNNWLACYSKEFGTVEINSSFYHLPRQKTFENWNKKTKKDFIFSVKASRYITHIKRLKDCREPLERLFKPAGELGKKLGPFLFQLPPNLKKDKEVFKKFLGLLPEKYKYAFEFREESWFMEDIYKLLEKHNCGVVISSSPGFPYREAVTSNLCYIRMHGSGELYRSCYSKEELKKVAAFIKKNLNKNIENYVYFNNDAEAYALENARTLMKMLL